MNKHPLKTSDIMCDLANCHHAEVSALSASITAYKQASLEQATADDLVAVMQASGGVILAAEQIIQAAEGIALTLRRKLAEVMVETGCPQVLLPHHKVSVTEPKPKLRVLDAKALPAEFLKQPPPVPDMDAIKRAWDGGNKLTGVAMLNGSAPHVTFHARKE